MVYKMRNEIVKLVIFILIGSVLLFNPISLFLPSHALWLVLISLFIGLVFVPVLKVGSLNYDHHPKRPGFSDYLFDKKPLTILLNLNILFLICVLFNAIGLILTENTNLVFSAVLLSICVGIFISLFLLPKG